VRFPCDSTAFLCIVWMSLILHGDHTVSDTVFKMRTSGQCLEGNGLHQGQCMTVCPDDNSYYSICFAYEILSM